MNPYTDKIAQAVRRHPGKDATCIATKLGASPSRVNAALKELREMGAVRVETVPSGARPRFVYWPARTWAAQVEHESERGAS